MRVVSVWVLRKHVEKFLVHHLVAGSLEAVTFTDLMLKFQAQQKRL